MLTPTFSISEEPAGRPQLFWPPMTDDPSGELEKTTPDDRRASRPPLSVVIPARDGLVEVAEALEALTPSAKAAGAEVVVVGGGEGEEPPEEPVRVIPMPTADLLALRRRGLIEARGEVVAIGEDHAVPREDWCEAVIRAHAERPQVAVVVGCLVNATDSTVAGRVNFLSFAAPWQPPMETLPPGRPPPASALSFKRGALRGVESNPPGWLEANLMPSLFARGEMAADDRIVVDHFQDQGVVWSITNAFHGPRASYGAERARLTPADRRRVAWWAIRNIPARQRREAREGMRGARMTAMESTLIAVLGIAAALGGALGTMLGPGRSPNRVA